MDYNFEADKALVVEFYKKEMKNEFLSKEEGRPIYYMADFVRIQTPGDSFNVIDTIVNDEHKKRFREKWAIYQLESGEGKDYTGTPLSQWGELNKAQAKEMAHYGFYTVEQVAAASDINIQNIGMVGGTNPLALKQKAADYLAGGKNREDNSMAALLEEIDKLRTELSAMKEHRPQRNKTTLKEEEKQEG